MGLLALWLGDIAPPLMPLLVLLAAPVGEITSLGFERTGRANGPPVLPAVLRLGDFFTAGAVLLAALLGEFAEESSASWGLAPLAELRVLPKVPTLADRGLEVSLPW